MLFSQRLEQIVVLFILLLLVNIAMATQCDQSGQRSTTPSLDKDLAQALRTAAWSCNLDELQRLYKLAKAEEQPVDLDGLTSMAVEKGNLDMLRYFSNQGAKWKEHYDGIMPRDLGLTFMQLISEHGWPFRLDGSLYPLVFRGPKVARLVLEKGANVDANALRTAVREGNLEVFKVLQEYTDNRLRIPKDGWEEVAWQRNPETAPDRLSAPYSQVRVINEAGLLQIAACYQHVDIVRHLLKQGAEVDYQPYEDECDDWRDEVNGTPLHKAVSCLRPTNIEVVKALVEAGADPLTKAQRGHNAFELNRLSLSKEEMKEDVERVLWKSRHVQEQVQEGWDD